VGLAARVWRETAMVMATIEFRPISGANGFVDGHT
jgi:hypothetical protein